MERELRGVFLLERALIQEEPGLPGRICPLMSTPIDRQPGRTQQTLFSFALLAVLALAVIHACAQPRSTALVNTPDRSNAAAMQTMQIPSHGALLNALVYVAAGAGPHPAVVLLHGFPD